MIHAIQSGEVAYDSAISETVPCSLSQTDSRGLLAFSFG